MANCSICSRELGVPDDQLSGDYGGDCLQCMAVAGDPTCIIAMLEANVPQDDMPACLFTDEDHQCQFTIEPGKEREDCWHYLRRCRLCRRAWYSTHCRCEQPSRTCGCDQGN